MEHLNSEAVNKYGETQELHFPGKSKHLLHSLSQCTHLKATITY